MANQMSLELKESHRNWIWITTMAISIVVIFVAIGLAMPNANTGNNLYESNPALAYGIMGIAFIGIFGFVHSTTKMTVCIFTRDFHYVNIDNNVLKGVRAYKYEKDFEAIAEFKDNLIANNYKVLEDYLYYIVHKKTILGIRFLQDEDKTDVTEIFEKIKKQEQQKISTYIIVAAEIKDEVRPQDIISLSSKEKVNHAILDINKKRIFINSHAFLIMTPAGIGSIPIKRMLENFTGGNRLGSFTVT